MKAKELIEILSEQSEKELKIIGQSGMEWVIDLVNTSIKTVKNSDENIIYIVIK
jgi:hypothetical protein